MTEQKISTPSSMAGIMRFYDVNVGGPSMDPRTIVIGAVLILAVIKVATLVFRS